MFIANTFEFSLGHKKGLPFHCSFKKKQKKTIHFHMYKTKTYQNADTFRSWSEMPICDAIIFNRYYAVITELVNLVSDYK